MNKEVTNIIKNISLLPDKYLVIGVSAGPDSMALLHMIKNNTTKNLVCAHINHNVRKSSNLEEQFLKSYCEANNIIFETMKILEYTENNFENEARSKRYAFFETILKKYHSKTLILAHHGDDLIETIMMKIERGSNIEGYAGIKTYSKEKNYTIIRPLLSLTKNDLLKYDKDNNIKYYIDESNENTNYKRNRLRKNLLPILKEENPDIHLKFLKFSETLQEYNTYIEDIISKKVPLLFKNNTLDINKLKKEDQFIKKNIIFYILRNIYNNASNIIKEKHIKAIIDICDNNKPNQFLNLPHNIIAKKQYNKLIFEKPTSYNDYKIEVKEVINIANITIKKVTTCDEDGNNVCRLNSKNIKLPLYVRNKKNGDKMSILGLNGSKKIKDIFIESKLPMDKRKTYPLLVDANDTILWIPNIKKSKYNAKKNELYDIILYSYKESEENNETKKEN